MKSENPSSNITAPFPEKVSSLEIPLNMYTLPSQSISISKRALERYLDCHQQNQQISVYAETQENSEPLIQYVAVSKQKLLIEKKLEDSHLESQISGVKEILLISSPEDQVNLIKKALQSNFTEVQIESVDLFRLLHSLESSEFNDQISKILQKGLESDNLEIKLRTVGIIFFSSLLKKSDLNTEQLQKIIKCSLDSDDLKLQKKASRLIFWFPESIQLQFKSRIQEIVEKGISTGNIKVQSAVADMIYLTPESEQAGLVRQIKEIIEYNLDYGNSEDQIIAIEMITKVDIKNRKSLVEKALKIDNPDIQPKSIKSISSLPKPEQKPLIEKLLKTGNIKIQIMVGEMILSTPESDQSDLSQQLRKITESYLLSSDSEIQREAIKLIPSMLEIDKKILFNLIKSLGLSNIFVESPLYLNSNVSDTSFDRKPFTKTGSEITLIGGPLKEKSIIRHITPKAFLSWQKIYDNYQIWQEAGFDYVPIEPIQTYHLDKEKPLIHVFSGVLDLSLATWISRTSLFNSELMEQERKIIEVLESQEVEHGHPHLNNFSLSFYRNPDGSINFNKKPQLYLIDFDQANS